MPQARADSGPQADHQADVQHLFVYRIHGYCFDTALGLQASPSSAAASGQGPAPRRLLPRQVQVAEVAKDDVDDGGLEEDADDEPRHRLMSTRLWRTEVQRDCPGRRKVWTLYTVEALESGIEASAEALYEISSGKGIQRSIFREGAAAKGKAKPGAGFGRPKPAAKQVRITEGKPVIEPEGRVRVVLVLRWLPLMHELLDMKLSVIPYRGPRRAKNMNASTLALWRHSTRP